MYNHVYFQYGYIFLNINPSTLTEYDCKDSINMTQCDYELLLQRRSIKLSLISTQITHKYRFCASCSYGGKIIATIHVPVHI